MQSEEFEKHLPGGGGQLVAHCSCGRIHFATGDLRLVDYEDGELNRLRQCAKEKPDQYFEDEQNDSIGTYFVNGMNIVWNCPCKYLDRLESFLVEGQAWIVAFYRARTERLRKEAAAATDDLAGLEVPHGRD